MSRTTAPRLAAVAALSALAFGSLAQVPAHAAPSSTTGLYGSADPTYDGVFRQSLGLMGLTAVGVKPAPAAITWLLSQQCANGSFEAYRSDLTKACAASDPVAATGPDTNSTALAITALMAIDDQQGSASSAVTTRAVTAAGKAMTWLKKSQNMDGGWAYFPGGKSDANSTGLSLAALLTQAPNLKVPALVAGKKFLGTLVVACGSPDGGALPYQLGAKPDSSASAQGLLGLTGTAPVRGPQKLRSAPTCSGSSANKVASYLSKQILAKGVLGSAYGDGPDYTATSVAVLSFVEARMGKQAVAKATNALATNVKAYTMGDSGPVAAAVGLLLMVAEATGKNPKSFGGVNLVTTLQGSQR
jgi:hypothetical protein